MKRAATREGLSAFWFGLPAGLGLAVFLVLPFLMAIALTFTNQKLLSPHEADLVGLQNYERLLSVSVMKPSFNSSFSTSSISAETTEAVEARRTAAMAARIEQLPNLLLKVMPMLVLRFGGRGRSAACEREEGRKRKGRQSGVSVTP